MTNYSIRIELNGATAQDYNLLHGYMAVRGFPRTIISSDGVRYDLPPAEYSLDGSALSIEDVFRSVDDAIELVGRPAEIVVSEVIRRLFRLRPAPAPIPAYPPVLSQLGLGAPWAFGPTQLALEATPAPANSLAWLTELAKRR